MGISSYYIYNILLTNFLTQKNISFLIAITAGMIIYILSIIVLKVLSEEELFMIPYGQKLYKMLIKMKIYKNHENQ